MTHTSDELSQEFKDIIFTTATYCGVDCQHGVTHFFDHEDCDAYEDGELETLRDNSNENPDIYNSCGYPVSHSQFLGKEYVEDCRLCCQELYKYEQFLTENDGWILSFYRARQAAKILEVNAIGKMLSGLEVIADVPE